MDWVVPVFAAGFAWWAVSEWRRSVRLSLPKPETTASLMEEVQGHTCLLIEASLLGEPENWEVRDETGLTGTYWSAYNAEADIKVSGIHNAYQMSVGVPDSASFTPPMIWCERLAKAGRPFIDAARLEREVVRLETINKRFNRS